ncbi:flagellar hook-associated protein FlgK [Acetobacter vaccinii]|uniref:Flagellar hook-associated protein 1 n=1 Tax=Acetobacter vaccinii TaxID=2592655 RepID=A0A5C1YLU6_9PROT|nr:flagellar hook-associated protein FlgK [Acetobacter vaccinii]QEO16901.1 flagellar hook-associated protein FlgK [Acetobacter vaccinii]
MDLQSSLSIASSGLNAIEYQYSVTSNNVANSGTSGYVSETATIYSSVAGGTSTGVRAGLTQLNVSKALQPALYTQNAKVAQYTALSNSLSAVSSVQGSTDSTSGSTNTLSDVLGNLQSAVTTLVSTPLESAAQSSVISTAQSVTSTIKTLSDTYSSQRQTAEDTVVSTVGSINTDLTQIGLLSTQIMKLKAVGGDTAALENQRYGVMSDLSSLVSVKYTEKSNGDVTVATDDGTKLPTRPDQIGLNDNTVTEATSTWPLTTSSINVSEATYYKDGDSNAQIPGISIAGTDVTNHLTGGTLGANITLRDTTYPQMQAQLDSLSYTLINRFKQSGTELFTNGTTTAQGTDATTGVPTGLLGLASAITVNSTYTSDPSSLAPSGDTTALTNILSDAFGSASTNVSGTLESPTDNLGPTGSISTGYSGTQSLIALATSLTSNQAATISAASSNLTSSTSVQTVLATKVSSVSGVNVNDELAKVVALQNAFTANAKVISAVQSMFTALMDAI